MQAREGAQAAVVPAGAQLVVVVVAGLSLLVVPLGTPVGAALVVPAGVALVVPAGAALVVPAGVALVVPAGVALLVVVVGGSAAGGGRSGRGFWRWRGEGERSRRMYVILFLLRPLLIKKTRKVFSCHLHVRDRDREYDLKFFYLILFSSKFTPEST